MYDVSCWLMLFSATDLDHVIYRMGLLSVLRSKCKNGKYTELLLSYD